MYVEVLAEGGARYTVFTASQTPSLVKGFFLAVLRIGEPMRPTLVGLQRGDYVKMYFVRSVIFGLAWHSTHQLFPRKVVLWS